jgi:glutamate-ammonia-ligase adenylyltransferase
VTSTDSRLSTLLDERRTRLRQLDPEGFEALAAGPIGPHLDRLLAASDYAFEQLCKRPALMARLLLDEPEPGLGGLDEAAAMAALRRYRHAESVRQIARDVAGLDAVQDTVRASAVLADRCCQLALDYAMAVLVARHGQPRSREGAPQQLVVFGLGKQGGSELNFSSDIDLVFAYPEGGETDGARALDNESFFVRLGQLLIRLLGEVTVDGFVYRVDMRLRPFGNSGRLALSFAAMEHYFQREGRDWERYAWQKARPVSGDLDAGARFLDSLRPFVYRRYLDYGALDGLREMKATIAAEVARRDLADDIKRGPGGIREIEFLAQALQLIRGGPEPALRERRLQPALRALCAARHLGEDACAALLEAYRFLRLLENRLQMLRDAQTQRLPEDALDRLRLARGLGEADWAALAARLQIHRERVSREFDALLAPRERGARPDALVAYWRALRDGEDGDDPEPLRDAGFVQAEEVDRALRDFARAPAVRDLSDVARARLDRLMPALLAGVAASADPLPALRRALALLQAILRRASYLALLDEQPAALSRLVDTLARSALLGDRLAAHPLLLDELLDVRVAGPLPEPSAFAAAAEAALQQDDAEAALIALNEARQTLSFRIALATLDRRVDGVGAAAALAALADALIDAVHRLALREVEAQHGRIAGFGFAVLGYGSLGGRELGFGSDLDLVFVYEAPADAVSDGPRPLDAPRWSARLAQKIVALLGTPTAAGRLYEVDVRLRPDGAKGLLVSSRASFEDYQRQRAWTWEHQALVRARAIAGDPPLCAAFEALRMDIVRRERDPDALRADVAAMRARMRAELDRSDAARFDLKQGEGGLVDLEFLLQYLTLREAARHPALCVPRDTPGLIVALETAGVIARNLAVALRDAHAALVASGLACTLDRRARIVAADAPLHAARAAIGSGLRALEGEIVQIAPPQGASPAN